jgi:hypothetical protein
MEIRPEIANAGDPLRHRPQRERLRLDLSSFDLLPRARR